MRQIVAAALIAATFGLPAAAMVIETPARFCILCPW
jgi:hypothetical protein